MKKYTTVIALGLMLQACAFLHSAQVGEIDSQTVLKGKKFELLVSETGVNVQEALKIGESMTQHAKTSDALKSVRQVIALFQMGPVTGNYIYDDAYADMIFDLIKRECPSGKISGLTSIRETNKYPVVSGEIVKITGFCKKS